jgi:hypothetical protein
MPDLVVCRLDPADPVLGGVNVLGEDAWSACHRRKENGEGDPHSERGDGGKSWDAHARSEDPFDLVAADVLKSMCPTRL